MQLAKQDMPASQAETMLARIAAGDKLAEQWLVDTYYRGLIFILTRQTQNPALAEDLVQDTFVVVIQKARENAIQNPAALASFIRQIGINLLIGHLRKENRRDTRSVEDIDFHTPAGNQDVSRQLHSSQLLQITTQLLEELTAERDRDVLRSYYVYDLSKPQVCQLLNLSPDHFDRVLFRARQRLKQLIEQKLTNKEVEATGNISSLLTVAMLLELTLHISNAATNYSPFLGEVREISVSQHQSDNTSQESDLSAEIRHDSEEEKA